MSRALLVSYLVGLAACATSPRAVHHKSELASIQASTPTSSAEAMLDRVEGEDERWVEVPNRGECPYPADELPSFEPVDDTEIPRMDPNRQRATNMDNGEESLDDKALLLHLDTATTEVLDCVTMASCYDAEPVPSGEIDFAFEVDPGGRVQAVDVDPSDGLDRWGVAACARKAIYETRFPSYDGGHLIVSYSIEIE